MPHSLPILPLSRNSYAASVVVFHLRNQFDFVLKGIFFARHGKQWNNQSTGNHAKWHDDGQ